MGITFRNDKAVTFLFFSIIYDVRRTIKTIYLFRTGINKLIFIPITMLIGNIYFLFATGSSQYGK